MTDTDHTKQATPHTREPWHYETEYAITTIFAPDLSEQNPYGAYIAEIDGQDVGRFVTAEQHEANARRICAAVNACQDLSTEALEDGILKETLQILAEITARFETKDLAGYSYAEATIATGLLAAARAVLARAALAKATAA